MKNFFLKYSIVGLVVLSCIFVPTHKSQAVIPVFDAIGKALQVVSTALQHVAIFSTGLPGSGAAVQGAVSSVESGCLISRQAFLVINGSDAVGVDVLAGSAGQLAILNAKLATLNAIDQCYTTALQSAIASAPAAASAGQQAITVIGSSISTLQDTVNSFDERIQNLTALRDQALKELWEGVAVRILMNVQQKVTTKLVNQMIAKYKISNYLHYADAVATQVYMANYISSKYPDTKDQLILKSILSNDQVEGVINPLVRNATAGVINFVPSQLDLNSPDFYVDLSRVGSTKANPYFQQALYQERADVAKANSVIYASQEISQGQGFIPARNCSSIVAKQNSDIDIQRSKLTVDLQAKQNALYDLQAKQTKNPSSVSDADIAKASQDITVQNDVMRDFGESNRLFESPCADILNPGSAIANFTNSYLQANLNVAANPKSSNLPFFANFVESTASNFLSNIISGAISGGGSSNPQQLSEKGFVTATIDPSSVIGGISESQNLKNADNKSLNETGVFAGTKDGTIAGQYILNWDVTAITAAQHIIIIAPGGFSASSTQLNGSIKVKSPAGTAIALTVYDSTGKVLTTLTYTIPVQTNPSLNLPPAVGEAGLTQQVVNAQTSENQSGLIPLDPITNGTATILSLLTVPFPQVAGASATKPLQLIRGPKGIFPRGQ